MAVIMETKKTVSQTLRDLRKVFRKLDIEDYDPIPSEDGPGYSVKYRLDRKWVTISSGLQPTRARNLRVCYDVISRMAVWTERGVSGIAQGVTFMGTSMAKTEGGGGDSIDEAFFTIGVDRTDDMEMVEDVYRTKAKRIHPDKISDPEEKKQAEQRMARLNKAVELIRKVKGK